MFCLRFGPPHVVPRRRAWLPALGGERIRSAANWIHQVLHERYVLQPKRVRLARSSPGERVNLIIHVNCNYLKNIFLSSLNLFLMKKIWIYSDTSLMWFFRCNYQNLQNQWTLEVIWKKLHKKKLKNSIFHLKIDFYRWKNIFFYIKWNVSG